MFEKNDLLIYRSLDREIAAGANGSRLLDLRGLRCPLPTLKIRKALRGMPAGAVLTAVCDDPLAAVDVPNVVREDGHELVDEVSADRARTFTIRKAAPPRDAR